MPSFERRRELLGSKSSNEAQQPPLAAPRPLPEARQRRRRHGERPHIHGSRLGLRLRYLREPYAGIAVARARRAPRYYLPNAAPEPLRLVQLFLNTSDHETGRELLDTPRALADWFHANGFRVDSAGRGDLRRARELRDEVRHMIATGKRGPTLEEAARRAKLHLSFAPPRLVPLATGVNGALGAIAAAVYEAMRDGSWRRLKTCRNCGWAFWDESKNRSGVWCSMQLCGSRLKARRYRRRSRERTPAPRSQARRGR
jgi:predicted RNA-binding Zn ribbon-like protein